MRLPMPVGSLEGMPMETSLCELSSRNDGGDESRPLLPHTSGFAPEEWLPKLLISVVHRPELECPAAPPGAVRIDVGTVWSYMVIDA